MFGSYTPIICFLHSTGLNKGPNILKIVLFPIFFLISATFFKIGWKLGANKKHKFIFFKHSIIFFSSRFIFIPNSESTSADPVKEDTALFPCFATQTPLAAVTIAQIVDMLNVLVPSPPVPHVSKEFLKPFIIFAFF